MNHPQQPLLTRTIARIGTEEATAATAALWTGALGWYTYHAFTRLPHVAVTVFDFGETMLLAAACLAFQLSALRVGIDHIWNATLDPAHTAPNPARWRIFGWIGLTSWTAAVAIGIPILASLWHPDSTNLIFALVIVLIPAVQCTGAAIVGPILTHAIQERETAREARMRIRAIAEAHAHASRQRARHHGVR